MRINQAQIKVLQSAAERVPSAKQLLRSWAEAQGIKLESAPDGPKDSVDALTESEMTHVSRPKGLQDIHAQGITGQGVTVAVVDSGIAPHPDFSNRVVAFRDFGGERATKVSPKDATGHGTHVAGLIAGNGEHVIGLAPEANLVGCRINSAKEAIKAIDWVIENKEKYSIDVLNLSIGVQVPINPAEDGLRQAAERAVAAGLVVVTASGNECYGNVCEATISSPGVSPDVITVGALDDKGTAARSDDTIYGTSSRGSEKSGKPDLIAEGANILAPLAPGSNYAAKLAKTAQYVALSGSSQAVPMVAGTVALMLQVNPHLTHFDIKSILTETAQSLKGVPKSAQGHGRLNLLAAVEKAQNLKA